MVPAEIEKAKIETLAEADAEKIRRLKKGEADGIQSVMEAEAKGTLATLQSKAEGFGRIVSASGGSADDATLLISDRTASGPRRRAGQSDRESEDRFSDRLGFRKRQRW